MAAQHVGVGGPLPVSALIVIPCQLTASSHLSNTSGQIFMEHRQLPDAGGRLLGDQGDPWHMAGAQAMCVALGLARGGVVPSLFPSTRVFSNESELITSKSKHSSVWEGGLKMGD